MEALTKASRRWPASQQLCRACSLRMFGGALSHRRVGDRISQQRLPSGVTQQRSFRSSRHLREEAKSSSQAHPLGDFYADLLATPLPKRAVAPTDLPTFVQSGDESKEARAAKLFGNIRGSGYERKLPKQDDSVWKTINGVPIPPRPEEPENCCMSGCMHCVWDDYRDDIEDWAKRLHEAQAKGVGQGATTTPKTDLSRPEVTHASGSMDDDGGGSEALWDTPSVAGSEGEELFASIPVGIREFMATEKRLRDRKKARKAKG